MKHALFLLVALCSADEIRTAECATACKYLSYASDQFNKYNCYCYDVKPYKDIVTDKQITLLPGKYKKPAKRYTWE